MSERTLKRLVGALAIVVALWVVTTLVAGGGGTAGPSGGMATIFDGISESSIEAVRLSGTDQPVELRREGEAWTVNGYAPDSATVARFIDLVVELEVGDLAATNPANHDRMGVSQDSAESMEIDVEGGDTRRVLIGKQGPRFATVYGRLPDEDQVYVLRGDLRIHAIRRLDDWRNKRIVAIDTSLVRRIEVERDGEAYTVVRADSTWTFEDGSEAATTPVRNMLMELANLRASAILEEGDSIAALEQGGSTMAYSESGEVLAEVRIGSGEADRWGRVPSDSVIYRLPSFRVDRITPERSAVDPES